MANNSTEKNSVKTSWIHVDVSSPIIAFIALPIIFLTFLWSHSFKEDYISLLLLIFTGIIVLIFIYLVVFKPENLTIDGRGHLSIRKELAKKEGGSIN